MNEKAIYEHLNRLDIETAVLREKVKRLEAFIYGLGAIIMLDIVGSIILWLKELISK